MANSYGIVLRPCGEPPKCRRYERNYTGEKRTEFVGFHLTPAERRELEEAAEEAARP